MNKISAVLIARNEKDLIGRCLESVKDADEIIVCDTGSTDETIAIAKSYTDKVYDDFVWCDSFAKARNHAKSKATGDWILSIDCDEFCHDFSKVREAVELAEKEGVEAVDITLIADDCTKQDHDFPRLFKNKPEISWNGDAHNYINAPTKKLGDVKITYGYSPAHFGDPDRTLRILKKAVEENPEAVRERFYLGREYWYRQQYSNCIEVLEQYTARSRYLAEKADALLTLARCYWATQQGDLARERCMLAIVINPNFKEAISFMSEIVWPRHAEQWKRMTATADNSEVLFRRNDL